MTLIKRMALAACKANDGYWGPRSRWKVMMGAALAIAREEFASLCDDGGMRFGKDYADLIRKHEAGE